MSHLPPLPNAASSPYPLHPEPIPEEQKERLAAETARRAADAADAAQGALIRTALSLGLAVAGSAVAGAFAFRYLRKPKPAAARKPAGSGDDKARRGKADRARVAAGQPYEVTYFARKHRISAAEARAIIKEAGSDRKAANALASRK